MADEYASLRLAYAAGATIQAWTLNSGAEKSSEGYWRDLVALDGEYRRPEFTCPVHLYRVKPDAISQGG